MASLIPSINSCVNRMQSAEKRFAWRLGSHLEDDYLCWYELPVGKRQRYSDFIILHPARGLLLLEVKDWKLDTIQKIDKATATIITSQGVKTVSNPLEQVRQCTYQLMQRLEKDPQLVNQSGRYQGNMVFPYGYGVVLSNITRRQFESTDLGEVLPEHQVICKDEMVESVEPEAFQDRLWNMFNVQFPHPLTLPQIDRIRWHLFPEVRINTGDQGNLFPEEPEEGGKGDLLPDIIKVMDMQQELLARSLGEGHRVIHGVAGSGKTLILGYRCLYLAKLLNKPILVLCYNITLAARLRELIAERGIGDKVSVYHFHDWCGEQLRTYHIDRPQHGDRYFDRLVETVISAAEKGAIPKGQYGAVMIDEGHDFEPEWLKLVVSMVDPETNVIPVSGTREALFMMALTCVPEKIGNRQPAVLMPNPFYQVYLGAAALSGAEPIFVPAVAETNFLPHGGGYRYTQFSGVSKVIEEGPDKRLFELQSTVAGQSNPRIATPRDLPYAYRGMEVKDRMVELGLGDPVVKLDLDYVL